MERISGLVHPDGLFHRPNPLKNKIKTKNLFDGLWQRPRGKEYSPRGHIVWQEYGLSGFSPPIEAFEDRPPAGYMQGQTCRVSAPHGCMGCILKRNVVPGGGAGLGCRGCEPFALLDENPVFGLQKQCSAFREWIPVGGGVLRE